MSSAHLGEVSVKAVPTGSGAIASHPSAILLVVQLLPGLPLYGAEWHRSGAL